MCPQREGTPRLGVVLGIFWCWAIISFYFSYFNSMKLLYSCTILYLQLQQVWVLALIKPFFLRLWDRFKSDLKRRVIQCKLKLKKFNFFVFIRFSYLCLLMAASKISKNVQCCLEFGILFRIINSNWDFLNKFDVLQAVFFYRSYQFMRTNSTYVKILCLARFDNIFYLCDFYLFV